MHRLKTLGHHNACLVIEWDTRKDKNYSVGVMNALDVSTFFELFISTSTNAVLVNQSFIIYCNNLFHGTC